jgi:DNA-binding NarL/FixJ family response regulator
VAPLRVKIAIVDDHPMVVGGLSAALNMVDGFQVVAHGGTTDEATALLCRDDLDVVLLDVRLEDGNGLATLATVGERRRARVLVLSTFKTSQYIAAAARYGASGFVLKSIPLPALVEAIRAVADGQVVFTSDQLEARFVALTSRERDVLRSAMDGLSNKEIAARLGLHPKTVEAYISEVFRKYQIHGGRIELTMRAAEEGWLEIQPPSGDKPSNQVSRKSEP